MQHAAALLLEALCVVQGLSCSAFKAAQVEQVLLQCGPAIGSNHSTLRVMMWPARASSLHAEVAGRSAAALHAIECPCRSPLKCCTSLQLCIT